MLLSPLGVGAGIQGRATHGQGRAMPHAEKPDIVVDAADAREFPDRAALAAWLAAHHATAPDVWVRMWRKATGRPSVTWEDCVVAALTVGWIDAQKRPGDAQSSLQRLVPRRPRSTWSQRNVAHAERLIAEGLMLPAGLAEVERARADGRWAAAYAAPSALEIPADFIAALEERPAAKATYLTLNRANLYAIYHRLHTARTAKGRAQRMERMLATLERGERFH